MSCRRLAALILVTFASLGLPDRLPGDEVSILLRSFCIDCHGAPDESPEGGFSLTADFGSQSLLQTGPTLKKALDAIEGYEMPPNDGVQPTPEERKQLAEGIRGWLQQPSLDDKHDPGRPVLRRLTRLEYNNTVRDLLGLETDVFIFPERLPFDRSHYQPQAKRMPSRVTMAAREYGAKYPVLLRDASMAGDSRAEYGFSNRGDAQSLTPLRLQEYVRLAGEIAFHPELLSRAERMEELFPNARFRQMAVSASRKSKPLTSSKTQLAANQNVARTADGSAHSLEEFRQRIDEAYSEDRGGVFSGEGLRNTKVAGKGGLVRVAYGKNAIRTFAINPNEDWWFAPFATAEESSGDTLLTNYKKGQRTYELTFQAGGEGEFAGIAEIALVVLSRRGEQGTVRLKATYDDESEDALTISLGPGAGAENTFASFVAESNRHIKRLAIDGREFSGDYVLIDDLAFITRDTPNLQPLIQAEEPEVTDVEKVEAPRSVLNRALAKESAARRLTHFLRRAFRREVSPAEIAAFLNLYHAAIESGGSDETAMRSAIQAILASPSFLFVTSRRHANDSQKEMAATRGSAEARSQVVRLSDFELAERMSLFLWSSMPDDELLELASQGKLQEEAVLESQVLRMLEDRRSIELSESFFVQWMRLAELWSAQPNKQLYPEFYTAINDKRTLAQDMFGEVLLLFQTIMVEDRSMMDLLDSDYMFVNGKMMQYYDRETSPGERFGDSEGRPTVDADNEPNGDSVSFRSYPDGRGLSADDRKNDRVWNRVERFDRRRAGVLTSPAVLTLTSFPHRTSSIRRGVWILDAIFNRHPPAPQVAVADIDEQQDLVELTLRQKVERHRENAACAVCHDRIDQPGFALENYDAIGRWRNKEGEELIDPAGELAGVGSFRNAREFRSLLLTQKRRFIRGFSEHLLSYALGRKLEYFDVAAVELIVDRTIEDDCRISRMILEIAKSYPFRNVRISNLKSQHEQ